MLNKDYSHLAGRKVLGSTVSAIDNGTYYHILEVALVEYDMGITLKPVCQPYNCDNPRFGTSCINGPSSPNTTHYTNFAEHYDEMFAYLADCIENYKVVNTTILGKIANRQPSKRMRSIACATGMPV